VEKVLLLDISEQCYAASHQIEELVEMMEEEISIYQDLNFQYEQEI
jgi:hypothetical protein